MPEDRYRTSHGVINQKNALEIYAKVRADAERLAGDIDLWHPKAKPSYWVRFKALFSRKNR